MVELAPNTFFALVIWSRTDIGMLHEFGMRFIYFITMKVKEIGITFHTFNMHSRLPHWPTIFLPKKSE